MTKCACGNGCYNGGGGGGGGSEDDDDGGGGVGIVGIILISL